MALHDPLSTPAAKEVEQHSYLAPGPAVGDEQEGSTQRVGVTLHVFDTGDDGVTMIVTDGLCKRRHAVGPCDR